MRSPSPPGTKPIQRRVLHREELGDQGVLGFGWSLQAQARRQGGSSACVAPLSGFRGKGDMHMEGKMQTNNAASVPP